MVNVKEEVVNVEEEIVDVGEGQDLLSRGLFVARY